MELINFFVIPVLSEAKTFYFCEIRRDIIT